jgi:uncharacterized protein
MNYDLDAIFNTVERLHKENPDEVIVLHGGEPLLLPFKDLDIILKRVYELQGFTTINTNGSLINDDIIKLFKRYKTNVALSIDGPYPLNSLRGYPNDVDKCKEYTNKLLNTIEILISEGIQVSPMIVLHRENAVGESLKALGEFLIKLRKMGIYSGKFNHCKVVHSTPYELTPEELLEAYKYISKLMLVCSGLQYSPIVDFLANLWGSKPPNDCYMSMCDIFHTERAKRIIGDGSIANCSCVQDVPTLQAKEPSYERYMALQKIPISEGGCKNCKYWNVCFGGCGASEEDWRIRDKYCRAFYSIYEYLEETIRGFESVFAERFDLAIDEDEFIIEDKPVHRSIQKIVPDNTFKQTTINGIRQIEYPDHVEVMYHG